MPWWIESLREKCVCSGKKVCWLVKHAWCMCFFRTIKNKPERITFLRNASRVDGIEVYPMSRTQIELGLRVAVNRKTHTSLCWRFTWIIPPYHQYTHSRTSSDPAMDKHQTTDTGNTRLEKASLDPTGISSHCSSLSNPSRFPRLPHKYWRS